MKELLTAMKPKCPLAVYIFRAGIILMIACYLLALILVQCEEAITNPALIMESVPALLETAPGFVAAGFTAAVLIEISSRDLSK